MSVYFEYKLYGTKLELENALNTIFVMTNKKKEFKSLINFNSGISQFLSDDKFVLTFCPETTQNDNKIDFDFEDMMYDLSKMFIELEIEGTGYFIDVKPYPRWYKAVGEVSYIKSYEPFYIKIHMKDYNKENKSFRCYIPFLNKIINIEDKLFKNENYDFQSKMIEYQYDDFILEIDLEV